MEGWREGLHSLMPKKHYNAMKYFLIKPEVAGGFGERTVMLDASARPPVLSHFHYKFEGWLGDELLTAVACFIVTEALCEKLKSARFSGLYWDIVEVSNSPTFNTLYPGKSLPKFIWMRINGKPGCDDFGIAVDKKCRLAVSERALNTLMQSQLKHCDIQPY